jgi:glucose/arabinose dehydrogenase
MPMLATNIAFLPGSSDFLIADQTGTLSLYRLNDNSAELISSATIPDVFAFHDCGLFSITLDPDFATNKFIYAMHCTTVQETRVVRLTFNADGPLLSDPTTIFSAYDQRADTTFHNGGALVFNANKKLLISIGDKRQDTEAQSMDSVLGKILEIDPMEPTRITVIAYGLREPWRGAFDGSGMLWVADVGDRAFEEINILDRNLPNFGWPLSEGPCFRNCRGLTEPLIHWNRQMDHAYAKSDPETLRTRARVAWVGLDYDASQQDRYDHQLDVGMIYGDFCAGWVRLAETANNKLISSRHIGHLPFVTSVAQASDGYIYLTTFPSSITEKGICPLIEHVKSSDVPWREEGYTLEGNSVLWRAVLKTGSGNSL